MNAHTPKRILLIMEDSHLALALEVVFREQGNILRWESDTTSAVQAMREFKPDVMLTASPFAVFISSPKSEEIGELSRPVDPGELQTLIESRFSH